MNAPAIAIDTQIVMRTNARRMVFGAAEMAGATVIVPETAAFFAKVHYHRVAAGYAATRVRWEAAEQGTELSDEEAARLTNERTERACAGFTRWLDSEPTRNDSLMRIAPRTSEAGTTAMELALAGAVNDREDRRWVVGEDPYVIAEALHAGAHWLASENFETLREGAMEAWLDEVQAQGRFTHVPRPFILRADTAVRTLMGRAAEAQRDTHEDRADVLALAHALSEPKRQSTPLARRVAIMGTFGEDIAAGGITRAGAIIRRWHADSAARLGTNPQRVRDEIEELKRWIPTDRVQRTRDVEDRRLALESKAGQAMNASGNTGSGHES